MDIRQLKSLIAVDDYGSFSAAADALGTVQSNVSAHISKLESELNILLVDRKDGSLTEQGLVVIKRARAIMSEVESIQSDLSSLTKDVKGRVRVGLIGTTARWLIPQLIEKISQSHPQMNLHLSEGTSSSLHRWLHEGVIDLAILNTPIYASDINFKTLFEEVMVLAVDINDPFAKRESISMAELSDIELLSPPKGNWFRDELDAIAAKYRVRLKTKAEIDGLRLIAALTIDGFGSSIVPSTAVAPRFSNIIATIPVVDVAPRKVGLARRKNQIEATPTKAFTLALYELLADKNLQLPKGVTLTI